MNAYLRWYPDEIGNSLNEADVLVTQRAFEQVQLHFGQHEVLTDMIVEIFGYLSVSPCPSRAQAPPRGTQYRVKSWKTVVCQTLKPLIFPFGRGIFFSRTLVPETRLWWRPESGIGKLAIK